MKPAWSRARMTCLPSRPRTKCSAAAATASAVSSDFVSSTRGMTGTGLKKWRPTTRSGRVVAAASEAIGIEDVFEASTASGATSRSRAANSSRFSAASSATASTTRSQPAKEASSVVNASRSSTPARSSSPSLPARAARSRERSMRDRPARSASPSTSPTSTSRPARAHTSAIPDPIWPQPRTPTRPIAPSPPSPRRSLAGKADLPSAPLEERRHASRRVLGCEHLVHRRPLDVQALGDRPAEAGVDGPLGERLGEHGARGEPAGEGERLLEQGAVVDHPVDEPHGEGLGSEDVAAGEDELLRARGPDAARQALGAAGPGDDPERHLGQPETGAGRGEAQVTGERELEAAAEGVAGDRRERRPREAGEAIAGAAEGVEEAGGARGVRQLGHLRTGSEVRCAAPEDERARRVGTERGDEARELVEQRPRQHVQPPPVEADHPDVPLRLVADRHG